MISSNTSARAQELCHERYTGLCRRIDRLFIGLLLACWVAAMITAVTISPRIWAGKHSSVHPHVLAAALLGGVVILLPIALVLIQPGAALTRHAIAVGQMLLLALLIHASGGRIETHFLIFGALAFLAFYLDWRVLVTASAIVAVDHLIRGIYIPQSVFGVATASPWRWLEHAGYVVFEDVVLVSACVVGLRDLRAAAQRQAELEASNAAMNAAEAALRQAHSQLELRVEQRTAELAEANEELAIAKEAAEAANHAKSAFLANMSHEIRTPIGAVIGFCDLLFDNDQSPSDRQTCVQTIRRNAQHLLELINDILDLSKIEAGKFTVESSTCETAAVLSDVLSMMRPRALEKGLDLTLVFESAIPKKIAADALRFRQVLVNLIGNAVKFTERGNVLIRAGVVKNENGRQLRFAVTDTGIGMSEAHAAQLFQPFTQADASMSRRFGGTGLGLTISRRLARLLGGDLTVSSTLGVGSTFTFTFDIGAEQPGGDMYNPNEVLVVPHAPSPTSKGPSLNGRILLVEDGPDNQRFITAMLRRQGAEVLVAENGLVGVKMATAEKFDVIFMDMQMPEMDGYQATRELRKQGYSGPIVALTAHAMADDRQKCLDAGCTDYLTKPIDRSKLIRTAEHYLKGGTVQNTPTLAAEPAPQPKSEKIRSEYLNEPAIADILGEFIEQLPQQVEKIERLLNQENQAELYAALHQIKGAGGSYGFPQLSEAAGRAEGRVKRAEQLDKIASDVQELIGLIRRVEGYDPKREKVAHG